MLASAAWPLDTARTFIGVFSNVAVSAQTGDCDGISIQLWKLRDDTGNQKISGSFYDAGGGCPGALWPISEAIFDASTGRIQLVATEGSERMVLAFKGTIESKRMKGEIGFGNGATGEIDNWSAVELKRLSTKEWKRIGGA